MMELIQRYEESLTAYNKAAGYIERGNVAEAEPILRKALALYPRQALMDEGQSVEPAIKDSYETLFSNIRAKLIEIDRRRAQLRFHDDRFESLQNIVDRNIALRARMGHDVRPMPVVQTTEAADDFRTIDLDFELLDAAPPALEKPPAQTAEPGEGVAPRGGRQADVHVDELLRDARRRDEPVAAPPAEPSAAEAPEPPMPDAAEPPPAEDTAPVETEIEPVIFVEEPAEEAPPALEEPPDEAVPFEEARSAVETAALAGQTVEETPPGEETASVETEMEPVIFIEEPAEEAPEAEEAAGEEEPWRAAPLEEGVGEEWAGEGEIEITSLEEEASVARKPFFSRLAAAFAGLFGRRRKEAQIEPELQMMYEDEWAPAGEVAAGTAEAPAGELEGIKEEEIEGEAEEAPPEEQPPAVEEADEARPEERELTHEEVAAEMGFAREEPEPAPAPAKARTIPKAARAVARAAEQIAVAAAWAALISVSGYAAFSGILPVYLARAGFAKTEIALAEKDLNRALKGYDLIYSSVERGGIFPRDRKAVVDFIAGAAASQARWLISEGRTDEAIRLIGFCTERYGAGGDALKAQLARAYLKKIRLAAAINEAHGAGYYLEKLNVLLRAFEGEPPVDVLAARAEAAAELEALSR
ncbi:MAG: hypothetical protein AB1742_02420 [bacterium]